MVKGKKKGFKVTTDERLNPRLKEEVQSLRGLMWQSLPQIKSKRFMMSQCPDRPAVIIRDTLTGKTSTEIGLCDLHGAIQVINELMI